MDNQAFGHQAKSQWIAQVSKELRDGNQYASLFRSVDGNLSIEPFYHPDDLVERLTPISLSGNQHWQSVDVFTGIPSSVEMTDSLGFDMDHILIREGHDQLDMSKWPDTDQLSDLSCHLYLSSINQLKSLSDIRIKSVQCASYSVEDQQELIQWSRTLNPAKTVLYAETPEELGVLQQLLQIVKRLIDWFSLVEPGDIKSGVLIKMPVSHDFLLEIAKFRAIKILAHNLFNAYELHGFPNPAIQANVSEPLKQDPRAAMISLTTKAISAVLAGVELLSIEVPPGKEGEKMRHNIRSIHHILKLEGYLDQVTDPLAGSYYIDKLTLLLAENTWKEVQKFRDGMGAPR